MRHIKTAGQSAAENTCRQEQLMARRPGGSHLPYSGRRAESICRQGRPKPQAPVTRCLLRCARTSQRLLLIRAAQGSLQLLLGHCLALADGVDGVGVARHDGKPFGVIPVAAQEGEHLVACVRQNDVSLQTLMQM